MRLAPFPSGSHLTHAHLAPFQLSTSPYDICLTASCVITY